MFYQTLKRLRDQRDVALLHFNLKENLAHGRKGLSPTKKKQWAAKTHRCMTIRLGDHDAPARPLRPVKGDDEGQKMTFSSSSHLSSWFMMIIIMWPAAAEKISGDE